MARGKMYVQLLGLENYTKMEKFLQEETFSLTENTYKPRSIPHTGAIHKLWCYWNIFKKANKIRKTSSQIGVVLYK